MNASHALKLVVASIVSLGGVAVAGVAMAGTSTCTDSDMIADGQQKLGGAFPAFGAFVIGQATAYARFLQWEWIEPWTSQPAYDRSQMDAACRTSSAAFRNYCDHPGFGS